MSKTLRRNAAVALSVVLVVLVGLVARAPDHVRDLAVEKLRRRGFSADIGGVEVGAWRVVLSDVRMGSTRVDGVSAEIRRVEVELSPALEVEEVRVDGVEAVLDAAWEDVKRAHGPRGEGGGDGRKRDVMVGEMNVTWERPLGPGSSAVARTVSWSSRDGLKAGSVELRRGPWTAKMKGLSVIRTEVLDVRAEEVELSRSPTESESESESLRGAAGPPDVPEISVRIGRATSPWIEAEGLDVLASVKDERASLVGRVGRVWNDRVELTEAEGSVSARTGRVDVDVRAKSLGTSHPKLAPGPVRTGAAGFKGSVEEREGEVVLRESEIRIGKAQAKVEGTWDEDGASWRLELMEVRCQDLLDSIPEEMKAVVKDMGLSGTIRITAVGSVDLPDRKEPSFTMSMRNGCRVESVPDELDLGRLGRPFEYVAYGSDGRRVSMRTGPGTGNWVRLGLMSDFVPRCLRTMEDPGFLGHRGFHIEAIENSMKINISEGRFVRGASTISMQLAKNLWLQREKTIARKIQEAFLTVWLEQGLSKNRILELYANVVEFAPGTYGIKAGANHYFRTHPASLTLGQALFLASVLPDPDKPRFAGAVLHPSIMYAIKGKMKAMHARGIITDQEYANGLEEVIKWRRPSLEEPEPEVLPGPDGLDPEGWKAN